MTRVWIGTALLAGSWLFSVHYFAPARPLAGGLAVLVATILLSVVRVPRPSPAVVLAGLVLALFSAWSLPGAGRAIALLLAAGLAVQALPTPRSWPRVWGRGALVASLILMVQAVALHAYAVFTARRHELPPPLPELVARFTRMMGFDATVQGAVVHLRSGEDPQRIAATWELLFDPASLLFLTGGLTVLALLTPARLPAGRRFAAWRGAATRLAAALLIWLPLRMALMIGLLSHRTLIADFFTAPNVGDVFVNSGLHVLLLSGLVLLAARLAGRIPADPATRGPADRFGGEPPVHPARVPESRGSGMATAARRTLLRVTLSIVAGTVIVGGLYRGDPVGRPASGRVMFVERHSTWEPTTEPYGTEIYGEAGSYNYAAIYDYSGQFFEMSRLLEHEAIDRSTLEKCDVLIIKTPTARYSEDEVQAVVEFVERGGGLLMIGDHTNVFNMSTYLNDLARPFGFTFRNDLLFSVSSPYTQDYTPPQPAHPALQHLPPLTFAVSCSIDPAWSVGRMVIHTSGLWNLPPDYNASNYHPQAEYQPEMQYGAWCQVWARRYGAGRVLAFSDSTLFSNFCTFQPGKAELFVGMVQWLNHRNWLANRPLAWLLVTGGVLAGGVLLATGVRSALPIAGSLWLIMAALLTGWSIAALMVQAAHRQAMPWPPAVRPLTHVVIDRELSEVPLFTGAFADDPDGLGYGLLEQWIPRLRNYLSRQEGDEVFQGDALVVICPTRSVSEAYQRQLERFVAGGGHLLVIDSPDGAGSTANSLLWPFGLSADYGVALDEQARLTVLGEQATVPCPAAVPIWGGEPIAWVDDLPVAAQVEYQQGRVTALGVGMLFNDAAMGFHWLAEPDEAMRERYDVLYALLRQALPTEPAATPRP